VKAWTSIAVLLAALPIATRAGTAPAQDEREQALARLRAEIEVERRALLALESAQELAALRERRPELARELVDLRIDLETAGVDRRESEARVAKARSDAERSEREREAVAAALRPALDSLSLYLREVPGMEERRAALLAAGKALRAEEGMRVLLETYERTLAESARVTLRTLRLATVAGRVEDGVKLLSAGHTRFAYRTPDDRVGLALASPTDPSGLRWTEELDEADAGAIRAAFDAIERGDTESWFSLPIDPSGRATPGELREEETWLATLRSGGPLMIPLGLVALAAAVLGLERFWTLFLRTRQSGALARRVLVAVEGEGVARARELCGLERGPVARTLAACLGRHDQGQTAMEDAIQEQLLHEAPSLRRFLRTLTVLAAIAPLVGLLGTVTGIIQTFGVIRALGTTDPTSMAGGISVALVTTATGLSIAIPILLMLGVLRGRGDRILSDVERYAASLLVLLAHGASSGKRGERV